MKNGQNSTRYSGVSRYRLCYNVENRHTEVKGMANKKKIPNATMKRLPLYYRYFKQEEHNGNDRVSSREISEALDIDSATIRRDFSYFGELGRKGYGYNIGSLLKFFMEHIQGNDVKNVILAGAGNLGSALLNYKFANIHDKMNVVGAFDSNESLVGKTINDIEIFHVNEMEQIINQENVEVAIMTVPMEAGQETAERLEAAGIKGILNFTPIRLNVSPDVTVHSIDLGVELQALFFQMKIK